MKNVNHEGYPDPTACAAIDRVERRERPPVEPLTYALRRVPGFKEISKTIKRR